MLLIDSVKERISAMKRRNALFGQDVQRAKAMENCPVYELTSVANLFTDWKREKQKKICHRPPFDQLWVEWEHDIETDTGVILPLRIGGVIWNTRTSGQVKILPTPDSDPRAKTLLEDSPELWGYSPFCMTRAMPTGIGSEHVAAFRRSINKFRPMNVWGVYAMNADCTEAETLSFNPPFAATDKGNAQGVMFGLEPVPWEGVSEFTLWPALMAFALLHCRNVVAETVQPDPVVNRRLMKCGEEPRVEYKVLKVEVPTARKARRCQDGGQTEGLKMRFHLCSGHFVHLRADCFTYKKGETIWRNGHARGDKALGEVHKRYQLEGGR